MRRMQLKAGGRVLLLPPLDKLPHSGDPDLVHHPDEALPPLAAFLGVPEKLEAMRAVIDPTLHRARSAADLATEPA